MTRSQQAAHFTHAHPGAHLPDGELSIAEVLDSHNARAAQVVYEIGEDWNDD